MTSDELRGAVCEASQCFMGGGGFGHPSNDRHKQLCGQSNSIVSGHRDRRRWSVDTNVMLLQFVQHPLEVDLPSLQCGCGACSCSYKAGKVYCTVQKKTYRENYVVAELASSSSHLMYCSYNFAPSIELYICMMNLCMIAL